MKKRKRKKWRTWFEWKANRGMSHLSSEEIRSDGRRTQTFPPLLLRLLPALPFLPWTGTERSPIVWGDSCKNITVSLRPGIGWHHGEDSPKRLSKMLNESSSELWSRQRSCHSLSTPRHRSLSHVCLLPACLNVEPMLGPPRLAAQTYRGGSQLPNHRGVIRISNR